MNSVLDFVGSPAGTAAGFALLAVGSWRCGWRLIGALVGVVALGAMLIALRDQPQSVIVTVLLVVLGLVAVVTAWSLVARLCRGSRDRAARTGRGGDPS